MKVKQSVNVEQIVTAGRIAAGQAYSPTVNQHAPRIGNGRKRPARHTGRATAIRESRGGW